MWKPVTAEHKPVKRAWLQWSIALLLSAGILLGLMAFARPKWQTIRIALKARDSAIIVEVPAHWMWEPSHHSEETYFFPPRPTGLWRWWNEHVIKSNITTQNTGSIGISVNQRPAEDASAGREELAMVAQASVSSCRRYFRDVEARTSTLSGISAFILEAHHAKRVPNTNQPDWRCVMLNSYDPIQHRSAMITITMYADTQNYSRLKPTMDEIIRRLRLVQK